MSENAEIKDQITKYVSNLDRDIYTVNNLPEEVVAVIFAYVSRSPKSFRENIGTVISEEQLGQERASKFHEKWVLNYGHASVAEHASVHVGIENVSRLFSSVLELSNEYLSFTEYSQRYQKPKKGDYYVPHRIRSGNALYKEYNDLCNLQYDTYQKLNSILIEHLKKTVPVPGEIEEDTHYRALEKVAFEDARYALNLATFTNLGLTANARAIEDSLSRLLSSKYDEVRKRAEEIKKEVRFSVPTLVKYAERNNYLVASMEKLRQLSSEYSKSRIHGKSPASQVRLLNWTGRGSSDPEKEALELIARAAVYEYSELTADEVSEVLSGQDPGQAITIFNSLLQDLGKHDNPVNILKLVRYEAEFTISEACWHQLLRHRKVNWIPKDPSILNGVTIPPNIENANATDILMNSVRRSEDLYSKLINEGMTEEAHYVVTNAHNRRILGSFDLWELYHLINLRMSEGAQWDIKNVTKSLCEEISRYHPQLVAPAVIRV